MPDLYLILSPELVVLTASNAYLAASLTVRESIVGKYLFDVFPGNGSEDAGHTLKNLNASLEQVLATKQPHRMEVQRYDLQPPTASSPDLIPRYWLPFNTPVLDDTGEVRYIIHKVEDVTEVVETRRRMEESEALLKSTEEVALTGSYQADLLTNTIYFSDGMFRLFGEEPGSVKPSLNYVNDRSHPEDIVPVREILNKAAIDKKNYYYTRRIITRSGEWRTLEAHGKVVCDQAGNATTFLGMVQDITERQNAQSEMLRLKDELARQASDKYRLLFDTMDEGFFRCELLFDQVGSPNDILYLEANRAATRLLEKDYTGKRLKEINPVDAAYWVTIFDRVVQSGRGERLEQYAESANRWFSFYVFKAGDGNSNQLAVLFKDITERKQHRDQLEQKVAQRTAELQQSTALLQSVFDTTLLGMSVLKAVRNTSGVITDFIIQLANKELQRETNRPDLEGKYYTQEYPGIKEAGLFDLMLQVMETGEPDGREYYYPFDGFNKWYSCQFVKLDDSLIATNLDITLRKQAEQEIFKNLTLLQQAEQVTRMGSWEYDMATDNFTWSEGMYRLFALPKGERVQPEIYLDYVLPADLPLAEKMVRNIKETYEPFEETLRLQVNDQVLTLKIKAMVQRDLLGKAEKVLGVDVDISEIKQLEEKNLHLRLEQQKALLVAILEAQEEERRRISESLHNGIGQLLYATKLNLDKVAKLVQPPIIQSTEKLLREAIQETRRVSHELVPIVLNDFGLDRAFTDLCSKYNNSTLQVNCETDGLEERFESHMEVALYRICQELLNNVVKHAQATKADILLVMEDGEITLKVRDNGKGVSSISSRGIGLRTIADRVKLLSGTFSFIAPASGKGTLAVVRIPL